MASQSRDIAVRLSWGDFTLHMVAEGSSWNPDVANDLVKRAAELFKDGLDTLNEQGLLDADELESED